MTVLARAAFALLVIATFAAFFVAQRLKSEPGVINNFDVVEYFSPVCECNRAIEKVTFRLNQADDVTVDVVDERGDRVARLARALPARAFRPVRLEWRGRTDDGRRAPDGIYKIRIGLRRQGRSVVAPFPFQLDTKPPTPAVRVAEDQHIVAPGQPVSFRVVGAGRRAQPEIAVLRTDDGEPEPVRRFKLRRGTRDGAWDGLGDDGRPVAPGTYLLQVAAADRSGNVGTGPRLPLVPGTVEGKPGVIVRGLSVQMPVRPLAAGQVVSFGVDPRGNAYRWSIRRVGKPPRKKSVGRKTNGTIVTRAPGGASGAYLLELRAGRYSAQIPFAVQSADRAPLLVVLPVIRWLGTNQLDDPRDPDGIPNTFATGSDVPYPRAFAGEDGLPQGFADEVAPLLAMLDRARVRYDITTDLELSRGREPRAGDRPGVLFAGSSRWVSRSLARRLRRYVADGGRLALFGTGALRAGVEVGADTLSGATQSSPNDALGGRISGVREVKTQLAQLADETETLRVFEGWDGFLGGFGRVEELAGAGQDNEVVAGIGELVTEEEIQQAEADGRERREELPAFSVVKQGKGYVFRVGIDGWVKRIAEGDAEVVQITRNVADLLRRVTPRVRSGTR